MPTINTSDPRWIQAYNNALNQQRAGGSTASQAAQNQAARDAANSYYLLVTGQSEGPGDTGTGTSGRISYNAPGSFTFPTPTGTSGMALGNRSLFGPTIMGDANKALPGGMDLGWHQLVLDYAKQMASQSGYNWTYDYNTNTWVQGGKTAAQTQQEFQNALSSASQAYQEALLSGTINGQPTLQAQQLQNQASQFAATMGMTKEQFAATLAENQRQFNEQLAFNKQKEAFNQANTYAQLAANPRTSIQASFLGGVRGGLGPEASDPMAGLRNFQDYLGGTLPQTQVLQGPDQGQAGSAAHYATETRPDGSQVLYFGTPTKMQDGSIANIPVGAFSRAIMEGKSVPSAGDIGTTGGYTTTEQVRSSFNPNRIKLADYLRASPSEQSQLQGVGSYAGYSPEDFTSTLSKFAPKERSISGGTRAY